MASLITSFWLDPEWSKIRKEVESRNVHPEKLLEEKLAPLQARISESEGHLMGAMRRHYEQCSWDMAPVHYFLSETLYAGIITPETRFNTSLDSLMPTPFMSGIKNPYSLSLAYDRDLTEGVDGRFQSLDYNHPNLLLFYFMEHPPIVPQDSARMSLTTEKPRLELYVGDKEVTPFLQNNLEGWRYVQLKGLLGYDLPITPEITQKIEKEQLEIYSLVSEKEKEVANLEREFKARLGLLEGGEGAIHHGTHIELTDRVVECMRYGPLIEEGKRKIKHLLEKTVKRGYHENGVTVSRELDAGITKIINLKEFFFNRKELLNL